MKIDKSITCFKSSSFLTVVIYFYLFIICFLCRKIDIRKGQDMFDRARMHDLAKNACCAKLTRSHSFCPSSQALGWYFVSSHMEWPGWMRASLQQPAKRSLVAVGLKNWHSSHCAAQSTAQHMSLHIKIFHKNTLKCLPQDVPCFGRQRMPFTGPSCA